MNATTYRAPRPGECIVLGGTVFRIRDVQPYLDHDETPGRFTLELSRARRARTTYSALVDAPEWDDVAEEWRARGRVRLSRLPARRRSHPRDAGRLC